MVLCGGVAGLRSDLGSDLGTCVILFYLDVCLRDYYFELSL